jgi:superfamily I DNA/RNA helicase
VAHVAGRWEDWKHESGLVDFTDLLEIALRDIRLAPGDPSVLIADEAQDFSRLQLSLIRQWGQYCDYMLVAGDEDQLLYGWCGCTPDAFLHPPVPEDRKRVLSQSYRVPRAVHRLADRWVKQLTVREPKEYLPRDADGEVRWLDTGNWRYPDDILTDADQYLQQGKTVMFLTTCSYMLDPLKRVLRAAGLPFHNPYRQTRGDWNPLRSKGTTAADRLLAFLRPREDVWGAQAGVWQARDLQAWVEMVKADGLLTNGAKARIARLAPEQAIGLELLTQLFRPEAGDAMLAALGGTLGASVDWLQARLLTTVQQKLEYPTTVLMRRGVQGLVSPPQIMLGTIHSVKGGQADVVYLFPDLSVAGMSEWVQGGERADAVIRQMYVGMTRARESLVVCSPVGEAYAPLEKKPRERTA